MAVTDAEYKKCNSTRPIFFSNTGNTVYRFNHSGSFYFISGVSGHCEKGQRMIVKVMSSEDSGSDGGSSSPSSSSASSSLVPTERFPVAAASVLVHYALHCVVSKGF